MLTSLLWTECYVHIDLGVLDVEDMFPSFVGRDSVDKVKTAMFDADLVGHKFSRFVCL